MPPSTSFSPASPSPAAPPSRGTPSCITHPRAPRSHRSPFLTIPSSARAPHPLACTSGGCPPHLSTLLPPKGGSCAPHLPSRPAVLMGEAPVAELDAVLDGGGWEVGSSFEGPPEPTSPICLGKNICYVVLAVLFNEEDRVLLVQEAKPECRGKWYLPAGRMEPGESIVAAMRREVKEETGLECEPLTLLALEERGPAWIRFAFLARPTGGTLKTLAEADAESLQAAWCAGDPRALPLRAPDILPLLDLAARFRRCPAHPPTLPQELPCARLCLRLLLACTGAAGDLWVLLGTAGPPRLPLVACGASPAELRGGLRVPVLRLLRSCLSPAPPPGPMGLLGLQHRAGGAGGADGVCFNVVLSIAPGSPGAEPPAPRSAAFRWWHVEEQGLRGRILQRLRAAVPVRS
ncbi:8-oxo-dGDP phosphatase NUDT18 [Pezoporus wallicus]|uniref:8-oxo-dGDP phosphatase NUDT18 n=1 Tax=Pezoporus wallicus TaxID=35540 RepID=UPI00254A9E22|nr:8-oxo-dGDP phosphatase NUDT18 [Pezoporus wallicus]